ncbi:MAG: tetratricopeptide repeat protein [Cyanobacteria bacterium P01_A01_bin.114]
MQANEDAFRRLVTFVDFAAERFTIGLVSVNFAEDRAAIIEALQQHPDCQEIQFVRFKFDDPDLRFLQDELIKELPKIEREPNKKLVLLLTGLEASIGMVGDYPPVLVDLNYVRNGFTTSAPYPMVIFLPDYSLTRLAKFAPDFWAWRMLVVRFESSPETVQSKLKQVIQHNGHDLANSVAKPKPTSGLAKGLDAQAKRDTIPRLLMEYEFGNLAQDENYQDFKADLMIELGISLYDGDDLEKAKDSLIKVLETKNQENSTASKPKALCYLGIIEGRQSNNERALDLLNQAITGFEEIEEEQLYPDLKDCLTKAIANRGVIRCLMESYSEALKDLEYAIQLDPDNEWAIAHRGITYRLIESYSKALNDLDRAIELDPDYDLAIAFRGEVHKLMERYPEALSDLTRAIELDPENEWAITNRGITYHLMARYPEALSDLTRAIELDPEYKWAIANRGVTYREMNQYAESMEDLTRAIKLAPKDTWYLNERGQTYGLMKQYKEALQDFDRALELDPNSDWNLAYRGACLLFLKNYSDALKAFDRAIELDSQDAWYHFIRAIAYLALKQTDTANADLARAIKLAQPAYEKDPQNWRNTFNLSLYTLVAQKSDRVQALYTEAVSKETPIEHIRAAISDLEDLLTILPKYPGAEQTRRYLQAILEQRKNSS